MELIERQLRRGTIKVQVEKSLFPVDQLLDIAERINPKRAFLFVSKVLGRHLAIRPTVIRDAVDLLARQIDVDLPGPVVFIGMAETAVGLGAGVHELYQHYSGRDDVAFICTTRHDINAPKLCEFSEDHSHATQHVIYRPLDPEVAAVVKTARTLVLVDDEASTGNTFKNLYEALPHEVRANVEKVVLVTLTDWSNGVACKAIPGKVEMVSIASGRFSWEPAQSPGPSPEGREFGHIQTVYTVTKLAPLQTPALDKDWGRFGYTKPKAFECDLPKHLEGNGLVLGTGEYVWQPYQVAWQLEMDGNDVTFAAISRSPISLGGPIKTAVCFADNYGMGVLNYCYNIGGPEHDYIVLCVETPLTSIDPALISTLTKALRPNGRLFAISSTDGTVQFAGPSIAKDTV